MESDDEALREVAPAVARAPPLQRRGISYSQPLSWDTASARLAALRNHSLDGEHILPASHSLSYAHHDPSAGVPAGYHPPLPPYQHQHHPSVSYSSAATSRRSVGSASDGSMTLERAMSEYGGGHGTLPEFVGAGGGKGIFRVPLRAAMHPARPPPLEVRPHPLRETQVDSFLRTLSFPCANAPPSPQPNRPPLSPHSPSSISSTGRRLSSHPWPLPLWPYPLPTSIAVATP